MNNQNQLKLDKKTIAIAVSLILLFIVVPIVYWFISSQKNPEGDSLKIKNLSSYTQGKPFNKDVLNYIEHNLFTTVNLNQKTPVKDKSVEDVLVREGSFSQDVDETTGIHTVKFIVDIESLKQSYDVSYQWSDRNKYSTDLDEWGTLVRCLPVDKLIYGDFKCRDMFTDMAKTDDDPLLEKVLPYEGDFYTIRHYEGEESTVISVQIMITPTGERTQKQFDIYKQEAKDWLVSQGVDLHDYIVIFRNLNNDVVPDAEEPTETEEQSHAH